MITPAAMFGLFLAAQAAVHEAADPARFEPLFRRHWETAGTAQAASDYGRFLLGTGDRAAAAAMLRKSIATEESFDALDALASIVAPVEAVPLLERAAKLRPSGDVFRRIGAILEAGGDLAAAEKRYRAALAAYEKEFGQWHPKTAVVLNDLGFLYENTGNHAVAEKLYRRALAIQEKAFGAEHPEVGTTLNNLGSAVGGAGRLDEAEPLLRRAIEVIEQTLGPRHERLAGCVENLAALLVALDRRAEARGFYMRAASIHDALGDAESAGHARAAAARVR